MAHELYTRTNQKIFFAGLSLESWKKAATSPALVNPALAQAEREATLFHLYGAVLGLCHEIAGYYRAPNAGAPRVDLLLTREAFEASPSPELAELLELAGQSETWLARLLAAHAALFQPPRAPAKVKTDPSLPLIEAVTLEQDEPPLTHDEAEAWRQQLKQLVLRFRESMTEW
ncbi:DUF6586 family protein [Stutzerimonas azotifigens]|uniref:DUF6586 family protein n=1 Tax=Stutzerimonas azotifigens TaxID=291995 RepID=UPI00041A6A8F|nr:DUF6586 family protein [Stutzerimonas azotifigens]